MFYLKTKQNKQEKYQTMTKNNQTTTKNNQPTNQQQQQQQQDPNTHTEKYLLCKHIREFR